ncbi:CIC11C00000001119 [Sungouiella intermedia]|uniref:CIC11C00000001119 n=1 Tax=Sungouiella intermedia TaxID=45354 RepID=A0A1L0BNG7_9ASCO|nr:CIC11C00000001119 [[Candida] intermedia]
MELNIKNPESEPEEDFEAASQLHIPNVRVVNLILDNSSFIRGFGNIKRWFDQKYIKSQLMPDGKEPKESIQLNIYIPSYTLHELEFLRKGSSLLATNARKALAFIDQIFDNEDTQGSFESNFVEGVELEKSNDSVGHMPLRYNVYIEYRDASFPTWNKCLPFKLYDLHVDDFPNHQAKFSSNEMLGSLTFDPDAQAESSDGPIQTPTRLRHLIRSCVFKRFIEAGGKSTSEHEQWKLITEDTVTRFWTNSYGIDCLNVNEAELLIFQSMDITSFNVMTEGQNFNSEHDVYDQPDKGILHQRIDTTAYEYHKMSEQLSPLQEPTEAEAVGASAKSQSKKKKSRNKKRETTPPIVPSDAKGDDIKREEFEKINFAPRVKGKLWVPPLSKNKKRS